jgi:hypothetical protein
MLRILLCAALLAGAARADCEKESDCKAGRACIAGKCVDRKSCFKDADCPGDQVCETSRCVAPSGPPSGWGTKPSAPSAPAAAAPVHEQEAAAGAGMALQYTKNTWPLSIVDRPLVVAPGMAEAQLLIGRDISNSSVHPFGASIYARYGVSDRIHAGLDALDLCFSDCGDFFSRISLGAGYAVIADHDQNLVPAVGLALENHSAGVTIPLQAGFLYAYRLNSKMQLAGSGSFALGVIGRDNMSPFTADLFTLQLQPRFEVAPRFALLPVIGLAVPLKSPDFWTVPLGLGALYVVDRGVDVGAQFTFGSIVSHDVSTGFGTTVSTGGLDFRSFSVYGTVRL